MKQTDRSSLIAPEEELEGWKAHPVTRKVAEDLERRLQDKAMNLALGRSLDPNSQERSLIKYLEAVGYCRALKDFLDEITMPND